MPMPIRPVRELEENTPSVLTNGGFSGLSPLQQMMLGDAAKSEAQMQVRRIVRVDVRDAENLHRIWLSNDGLEAKASLNEEGEGPTDIPISMTHAGNITHFQLDGKIEPKQLIEAIELAKKSCEEIYEVQKKALKDSIDLNGGED